MEQIGQSIPALTRWPSTRRGDSTAKSSCVADANLLWEVRGWSRGGDAPRS